MGLFKKLSSLFKSSPKAQPTNTTPSYGAPKTLSEFTSLIKENFGFEYTILTNYEASNIDPRFSEAKLTNIDSANKKQINFFIIKNLTSYHFYLQIAL